MIKKATLVFFITVLFFSCNNGSNKRIIPSSSGKINTLSVIVDNDLWKGKVGEAMRSIFAAPVEGLSQDEPLFSMKQMPPQVFSGFTTESRTILKVEKGTENGVSIKSDVFARPQTYIVVSGKTSEDIISELKNNSVKIIDAFKKEEIKEKQRQIKLSLFNDKELEEKFGFSMNLASAYRTAKSTDDFLWLRRDVANGTMDLMIYDVPLSSIRKGDSAVVDVVRVRDSVGKVHIEGGIEGSYLGTEPAYAPYIFETILDNKPTLETKGLWDLKNAYMSGPFINYAIEDKVNKRYLIVEGYVFGPSLEMRDYMFELESIIKSIKIK